MDPLSELENAISAELLRASLLGAPRPRLAERYRLRRFLGRGASGLVVEADDERLGRIVALKLGDARGESAMIAEARALAALDHPNVVRVFDADLLEATLDGRGFRLWFVSMQRVAGRSLRAFLAERPRTTAEILAVFVDAGRGLYAAHRAKLLHRDFKPDNVVVGDDGVAQVLDFGFATAAMSMYSELRGAQSAVVGTDPYLAPEARLARASRRSDQYSFGVSFVEALTGEPTAARGRPPEGVPRALWSALVRATSESLDDRYPDMGALLDALAGTPSPRRGPRAAALAALVVVPVVVAASLVLLRPTGESGSRGTATGRVDGAGRAPAVDAGDRAAAVDAGAPRDPAAALDAGPRCPSLVGRYRLVTREESANRGDDPLIGEYLLAIRSDGDGAGAASLRKTASGREGRLAPRDQSLEPVRVARQVDCGLRLEATLPGARVYVFELRFEPEGPSGRFVTRPLRPEAAFRGAVSGTRLPGG